MNMFNGYNQPLYESDPGRDGREALKKPGQVASWSYPQSYFNPDTPQQSAPSWQAKASYAGKCACAQCQQPQPSWYPKDQEMSSSAAQDVMMIGMSSGASSAADYPSNYTRMESYLPSLRTAVPKQHAQPAYPTPSASSYAPRIAAKQPSNADFTSYDRGTEPYMRAFDAPAFLRKHPEQRAKYWDNVNSALYPSQQYQFPPSCRYPPYNTPYYPYESAASTPQQYHYPQPQQPQYHHQQQQQLQQPQAHHQQQLQPQQQQPQQQQPQHGVPQQYYGIVPNPMRQMQMGAQSGHTYFKHDLNGSKMSPLRLLRKKKSDLVEQMSPPRMAQTGENPPLDVRRFLATWADEDDDSSPIPQMVVLDCQDINEEQAELLRAYEQQSIRLISEPTTLMHSEAVSVDMPVRPTALMHCDAVSVDLPVRPTPIMHSDAIPVDISRRHSALINSEAALTDHSVRHSEAVPVVLPVRPTALVHPETVPTDFPVRPTARVHSQPSPLDLPLRPASRLLSESLPGDFPAKPSAVGHSAAVQDNIRRPTSVVQAAPADVSMTPSTFKHSGANPEDTVRPVTRVHFEAAEANLAGRPPSLTQSETEHVPVGLSTNVHADSVSVDGPVTPTALKQSQAQPLGAILEDSLKPLAGVYSDPAPANLPVWPEKPKLRDSAPLSVESIASERTASVSVPSSSPAHSLITDVVASSCISPLQVPTSIPISSQETSVISKHIDTVPAPVPVIEVDSNVVIVSDKKPELEFLATVRSVESSCTPSPDSPTSLDSLPALADLPTSEYRKNKFLDYDPQSFPHAPVRTTVAEALESAAQPEAISEPHCLGFKKYGKKRGREHAKVFSIQKSQDLKISLRVCNENNTEKDQQSDVAMRAEDEASGLIVPQSEDDEIPPKWARKFKRRRLIETSYSVSSEEHSNEYSTDGLQEAIDQPIKLTFKRKKEEEPATPTPPPKRKRGRPPKTQPGSISRKKNETKQLEIEEAPVADTTTDHNGYPPKQTTCSAPLLLPDSNTQYSPPCSFSSPSPQPSSPRRIHPPSTLTQTLMRIQRRSISSSPKISSSCHITSPRTSTDSIERELQAIWNGDVGQSDVVAENQVTGSEAAVTDTVQKLENNSYCKSAMPVIHKAQQSSDDNVVDFYTEDISTDTLLNSNDRKLDRADIRPETLAESVILQRNIPRDELKTPSELDTQSFHYTAEISRPGVIFHSLDFADDYDACSDKPLDLTNFNNVDSNDAPFSGDPYSASIADATPLEKSNVNTENLVISGQEKGINIREVACSDNKNEILVDKVQSHSPCNANNVQEDSAEKSEGNANTVNSVSLTEDLSVPHLQIDVKSPSPVTAKRIDEGSDKYEEKDQQDLTKPMVTTETNGNDINNIKIRRKGPHTPDEPYRSCESDSHHEGYSYSDYSDDDLSSLHFVSPSPLPNDMSIHSGRLKASVEKRLDVERIEKNRSKTPEEGSKGYLSLLEPPSPWASRPRTPLTTCEEHFSQELKTVRIPTKEEASDNLVGILSLNKMQLPEPAPCVDLSLTNIPTVPVKESENVCIDEKYSNCENPTTSIKVAISDLRSNSFAMGNNSPVFSFPPDFAANTERNHSNALEELNSQQSPPKKSEENNVIPMPQAELLICLKKPDKTAIHNNDVNKLDGESCTCEPLQTIAQTDRKNTDAGFRKEAIEIYLVHHEANINDVPDATPISTLLEVVQEKSAMKSPEPAIISDRQETSEVFTETVTQNEHVDELNAIEKIEKATTPKNSFDNQYLENEKSLQAAKMFEETELKLVNTVLPSNTDVQPNNTINQEESSIISSESDTSMSTHGGTAETFLLKTHTDTVDMDGILIDTLNENNCNNKPSDDIETTATTDKGGQNAPRQQDLSASKLSDPSESDACSSPRMLRESNIEVTKVELPNRRFEDVDNVEGQLDEFPDIALLLPGNTEVSEFKQQKENMPVSLRVPKEIDTLPIVKLEKLNFATIETRSKKLHPLSAKLRRRRSRKLCKYKKSKNDVQSLPKDPVNLSTKPKKSNLRNHKNGASSSKAAKETALELSRDRSKEVTLSEEDASINRIEANEAELNGRVNCLSLPKTEDDLHSSSLKVEKKVESPEVLGSLNTNVGRHEHSGLNTWNVTTAEDDPSTLVSKLSPATFENQEQAGSVSTDPLNLADQNLISGSEVLKINSITTSMDDSEKGDEASLTVDSSSEGYNAELAVPFCYSQQKQNIETIDIWNGTNLNVNEICSAEVMNQVEDTRLAESKNLTSNTNEKNKSLNCSSLLYNQDVLMTVGSESESDYALNSGGQVIKERDTHFTSKELHEPFSSPQLSPDANLSQSLVTETNVKQDMVGLPSPKQRSNSLNCFNNNLSEGKPDIITSQDSSYPLFTNISLKFSDLQEERANGESLSPETIISDPQNDVNLAHDDRVRPLEVESDENYNVIANEGNEAKNISQNIQGEDVVMCDRESQLSDEIEEGEIIDDDDDYEEIIILDDDECDSHIVESKLSFVSNNSAFNWKPVTEDIPLPPGRAPKSNCFDLSGWSNKSGKTDFNARKSVYLEPVKKIVQHASDSLNDTKMPQTAAESEGKGSPTEELEQKFQTEESFIEKSELEKQKDSDHMPEYSSLQVFSQEKAQKVVNIAISEADEILETQLVFIHPQDAAKEQAKKFEAELVKKIPKQEIASVISQITLYKSEEKLSMLQDLERQDNNIEPAFDSVEYINQEKASKIANIDAPYLEQKLGVGQTSNDGEDREKQKASGCESALDSIEYLNQEKALEGVVQTFNHDKDIDKQTDKIDFPQLEQKIGEVLTFNHKEDREKRKASSCESEQDSIEYLNQEKVLEGVVQNFDHDKDIGKETDNIDIPQLEQKLGMVQSFNHEEDPAKQKARPEPKLDSLTPVENSEKILESHPTLNYEPEQVARTMQIVDSKQQLEGLEPLAVEPEPVKIQTTIPKPQLEVSDSHTDNIMEEPTMLKVIYAEPELEILPFCDGSEEPEILHMVVPEVNAGHSENTRQEAKAIETIDLEKELEISETQNLKQDPEIQIIDLEQEFEVSLTLSDNEISSGFCNSSQIGAKNNYIRFRTTNGDIKNNFCATMKDVSDIDTEDCYSDEGGILDRTTCKSPFTAEVLDLFRNPSPPSTPRIMMSPNPTEVNPDNPNIVVFRRSSEDLCLNEANEVVGDALPDDAGFQDVLENCLANATKFLTRDAPVLKPDNSSADATEEPIEVRIIEEERSLQMLQLYNCKQELERLTISEIYDRDQAIIFVKDAEGTIMSNAEDKNSEMLQIVDLVEVDENDVEVLKEESEVQLAINCHEADMSPMDKTELTANIPQTDDHDENNVDGAGTRDILLASYELTNDLNPANSTEVSLLFSPFDTTLSSEALPVDNWPYLEEEVPMSPTWVKNDENEIPLEDSVVAVQGTNDPVHPLLPNKFLYTNASRALLEGFRGKIAAKMRRRTLDENPIAIFPKSQALSERQIADSVVTESATECSEVIKCQLSLERLSSTEDETVADLIQGNTQQSTPLRTEAQWDTKVVQNALSSSLWQPKVILSRLADSKIIEVNENKAQKNKRKHNPQASHNSVSKILCQKNTKNTDIIPEKEKSSENENNLANSYRIKESEVLSLTRFSPEFKSNSNINPENMFDAGAAPQEKTKVYSPTEKKDASKSPCNKVNKPTIMEALNLVSVSKIESKSQSNLKKKDSHQNRNKSALSVPSGIKTCIEKGDTANQVSRSLNQRESALNSSKVCAENHSQSKRRSSGDKYKKELKNDEKISHLEINETHTLPAKIFQHSRRYSGHTNEEKNLHNTEVIDSKFERCIQEDLLENAGKHINQKMSGVKEAPEKLPETVKNVNQRRRSKSHNCSTEKEWKNDAKSRHEEVSKPPYTNRKCLTASEIVPKKSVPIIQSSPSFELAISKTKTASPKSSRSSINKSRTRRKSSHDNLDVVLSKDPVLVSNNADSTLLLNDPSGRLDPVSTCKSPDVTTEKLTEIMQRCSEAVKTSKTQHGCKNNSAPDLSSSLCSNTAVSGNSLMPDLKSPTKPINRATDEVPTHRNRSHSMSGKDNHFNKETGKNTIKNENEAEAVLCSLVSSSRPSMDPRLSRKSTTYLAKHHVSEKLVAKTDTMLDKRLTSSQAKANLDQPVKSTNCSPASRRRCSRDRLINPETVPNEPRSRSAGPSLQINAKSLKNKSGPSLEVQHAALAHCSKSSLEIIPKKVNVAFPPSHESASHSKASPSKSHSPRLPRSCKPLSSIVARPAAEVLRRLSLDEVLSGMASDDEATDTEQAWVCRVCGFNKVDQQQNHIQEHSFHCQSCHLAFKSESHFIRHLTRRHEDIRKMHHCLLCELSFDTDVGYYEHMASREHRHIEAVEKNTIHTLFSLLSGQPCPVLGNVQPRSEWLPSQAGTVHFYHQATPLSLAMQYWKMKQSSAVTK